MSKNRNTATLVLIVAALAALGALAAVSSAPISAMADGHHDGWSNPNNPHYVPPCPPTGCIQ